MLKGDLILRGTGDPALDLADLLELAVQLGNLGVFRVEGRFLIDDTAFPVLSEIDPRQPAEAAYNPGIGPLSVAFNRVRVAWRGGRAAADHPAAARGGPLRGDVALAAAARRRRPRCRRRRGGGLAGRRSRPPPAWRRCRSRTRACTPVACSASSRAARASCSMRRSAARRRARRRLLAVHQSAPMRILLRDMLVYSNNMMAEMIGSRRGGTTEQPAAGRPRGRRRARGAASRPPPARGGLEHAPRSATIPASTPAARLTPRQLAAIARYGWHANALPALLPGGGWSGTLADRFDRPDQSLRVWAKTGTMNYGSSLAGYPVPRPATARRCSRPWCRTSARARPTMRRAARAARRGRRRQPGTRAPARCRTAWSRSG